MLSEFRNRLQDMPDAKRLALAIYGESVASYRYSVLAEKSSSEAHCRIFRSMQAEEREHQELLEDLSRKLFPTSDFVLSPEDKELVIVGKPMLDVSTPDRFARAMRFLHDTEKRTAEFYTVLHELMPDGAVGEVLNSMAKECYEHAESLLAIDPPTES